VRIEKQVCMLSRDKILCVDDEGVPIQTLMIRTQQWKREANKCWWFLAYTLFA
jgi:hypothetical protein